MRILGLNVDFVYGLKTSPNRITKISVGKTNGVVQPLHWLFFR